MDTRKVKTSVNSDKERRMNIRSLTLVIFLGFPVMVSADLSGTWSCNDGGTYYLRQDGTRMYWYGEQAPEKPAWSNVFYGKVVRGSVSGNWMDVPKGPKLGKGELTLKISNNENTLVATNRTGGFGGTKWNRKIDIEHNIDRRGKDIKKIELSQSDPKKCINACIMNERCLAWTYVNPGVQGPKAQCYIKSQVPTPTFNTCCVSGVITNREALNQMIRYQKRVQ